MLFYFLARYPEHAERVFQEISTIDTSDLTVLASLPILNGFINETMRIIPAALTMGTRITPPEGLQIDGTWIPGSTKIVGPRYTIFRSKISDLCTTPARCICLANGHHGHSVGRDRSALSRIYLADIVY